MSEIKISKGTSNRIRVSFPYNKDHVAKIKTIGGYKWHPEEKHWSFPYSEDTLKKILSAFSGENINIDPSLQMWHTFGQIRSGDSLPRVLMLRKIRRANFGTQNFSKILIDLKENSFQENTAQKQLRHIFTTTKNLLNLPIRCPIP